MKLKIKKSIFLGLISVGIPFLTNGIVNAQQIYSSTPSFKTIFENRKNINSYYVGDNPAYLKFENSDQLLSLQSSYLNSDGEFKKFIDPSASKLYQVSASGKKAIDSFQVFKGSFAFQRLERKNWNWLVSKYYNDFDPFLFGDSTSGSAHYNGIVMNAQYSAAVFDQMLLGFLFNYSVDEGLKEVFPHPTSNHRDIDLSLGIGYLLTGKLSIGASTKIYDYNEKIVYQEDQGAVYREVYLLKFKGFDFPFVNKKKTETRYAYRNGIFSYGNLSLQDDAFQIAGYFGGGVEQLTLKDDATDPVTQGYWNNKVYEGALKSSFKLVSDLFIGFNYNFRQDNMWAKHPGSSILMMENNMPRHSLTSGLEYVLSEYVCLGVEGSFEFNKIDFNDYYSHIFWQLKGNSITGSLGGDIKWNSLLRTYFAYGLNKYSAYDKFLSNNIQSDYYTDYRVKDILFYMTDYLKHSLNAKISIEPARWGLINIYLAYNTLSPESTSDTFKNLRRNEFISTVELKIKAY